MCTCDYVANPKRLMEKGISERAWKERAICPERTSTQTQLIYLILVWKRFSHSLLFQLVLMHMQPVCPSNLGGRLLKFCNWYSVCTLPLQAPVLEHYFADFTGGDCEPCHAATGSAGVLRSSIFQISLRHILDYPSFNSRSGWIGPNLDSRPAYNIL